MPEDASTPPEGVLPTSDPSADAGAEPADAGAEPAAAPAAPTSVITFTGDGPLADATFEPDPALLDQLAATDAAEERAAADQAAFAAAMAAEWGASPGLSRYVPDGRHVPVADQQYEVAVDTLGHPPFELPRGTRFTGAQMASVHRDPVSGARVPADLAGSVPAFDLPWLIAEGVVRPVPDA